MAGDLEDGVVFSRGDTAFGGDTCRRGDGVRLPLRVGLRGGKSDPWERVLLW